jgi:general secretion pathway protein G
MRTPNSRHRRAGFTLVELLIVVAILGVISGILIPNLLDALQRAKQKRTLADINGTGAAWMSWLTNEISAAAAGSAATYDFSGSLTQQLTPAELAAMLRPAKGVSYANYVPQLDAWGAPYDYRWSADLSQDQMIGIRSFGQDEKEGPTANPYPAGDFLFSNYAEDIVWADGYFVRFPRGVLAD